MCLSSYFDLLVSNESLIVWLKGWTKETLMGGGGEGVRNVIQKTYFITSFLVKKKIRASIS